MSLQLSAKSVGLFEAFYSSIRPASAASAASATAMSSASTASSAILTANRCAASRTAMGNPVTFWIVQVIAWAVVVGNWVSMDCETEGGARIAAYTVGLVMFGIATVFNFVVNGANKGS